MHLESGRSFRSSRHRRPSFLTLLLTVLSALSSCSGAKHIPLAPVLPSIFASYAEPSWHPGGNVIVFNHTPLVRRYWDPGAGQYTYVFSESLSGFYIVNVDGTGQHRLLPYFLHESDWDSSGTSLTYQISGVIAYAAGSDTGVAAGTATQITSGLAPSFAPTWTTGDALSYSVYRVPEAGIYLTSKLGGDGHRVGSVNWRQADWSQRGDSLVFVFADSSRTGIGIADTSGMGFRPLWAYPQAIAHYPRWSPNGTSIAFTGRSSNAASNKLWVMNADGSNARTLTSGGVQDFYSWGPNGREIVYVRYNYADTSLTNGTIWIVDVTTGVERQVTYNAPSN